MTPARRRRRLQRRHGATRGIFCEGHIWTGQHRDEPCPYYATGYQRQNDIYVCGHHARAYLNVTPIARVSR